MNIEFYKQDVKRIFKENDIHYEWWVQDDGAVDVVIEWGDWKHDHLFLSHVMQENNYHIIEKIIREEDETDAYSAEYVFKYGV